MFGIGVTLFNNVEWSKECLLSLARFSTLPYTLYLNDNGSDPHNGRAFEEFAKGEFAEVVLPACKAVKMIPTSPDPSWHRAKRIGTGKIRQIEAMKEHRYNVLADNDIIYTPGWMEHSIAILSVFPEVGMMNPAQVYAPSHIVRKEVHRKGLTIRIMSTLAGFCLVFDRSRYQSAGCPIYPDFPQRYGPEHGNWDEGDTGFCNGFLDGGFLLAVPIGHRITHKFQPHHYK